MRYLILFIVTTMFVNPVFAKPDMRDRNQAYKNIMAKISTHTVKRQSALYNSKIRKGCGSPSVNRKVLSLYNEMSKPKLMFACVNWFLSSKEDIHVTGARYVCGKRAKFVRKELMRCIKNFSRSTNCSCVLVDSNGKNALTNKKLKRHLK